MKMTREFIDVALAKKYMAATEKANKAHIAATGHPINRPKRDSVIAKYTRDLLNKRWVESHQGMLLGKDDRIIDGQHRIAAIIRSGIGQWFYVFRDPALLTAFDLPVDTGAKRSTSIVNNTPPRLNAVAVLALDLLTSINNPSSADVKDYADAFEDAYNIMEARTKTLRKGVTTAGMHLAVVVSLMLGRDQKYVLDTFDAMVHDWFAEIPPYPASLYKQLVILRVRFNQRQVFARAIRALDPKRRDTKKQSVLDEDVALEEAKTYLRRALHPSLLPLDAPELPSPVLKPEDTSATF